MFKEDEEPGLIGWTGPGGPDLKGFNCWPCAMVFDTKDNLRNHEKGGWHNNPTKRTFFK